MTDHDHGSDLSRRGLIAATGRVAAGPGAGAALAGAAAPAAARGQGGVVGRTGVPAQSVQSHDTFDAIRDNPDIDVVHVAAPNPLHRDLWSARSTRAGTSWWKSPWAPPSRSAWR